MRVGELDGHQFPAAFFHEFCNARGAIVRRVAGPTSFGLGGQTFVTSGAGDFVGLQDGAGAALLIVPAGYVSDSFLMDSSTYAGQTLSSLGATPGAYEWTWGSGANQNFTLIIGEVPEPSTWAMMLLGFAGLGFAGYRKSRWPAASAA